ncbi:MAG: alpha/beta hydrolase, partial [Erythrobacter sp.]|nr:alpha/beta hydrolase [Erythrobacter sp.]
MLVFGGIALQIAISRNGPAVLDTVDRLAGGSRGVAQIAKLTTGDHPAQKVILWGPEAPKAGERSRDAAPLPVLLFAHGGSWRSGDPEDYGFLARAFVPEGFIVALSGYRLVKEGAPDGVYPAMLEDTAAAIAATREAAAQYGGDPDRIVLMGHSAGAY